VPPGFYYASEALNVTQTHGITPRHVGVGRSDGLEDRCYGAQRWRRNDGQWFGASSAGTVEEWFSAGSASTVEEWLGASSTSALEVAGKQRN